MRCRLALLMRLGGILSFLVWIRLWVATTTTASNPRVSIMLNEFSSSVYTPPSTDHGEPSARSDHRRASCFQYNSISWLNSTRLSNDRQTLTASMSLSSKTSASFEHLLLQDTICLENTRFRNTSETGLDPRSLRLWTARLVYLAIHHHQHRHARQEAQRRQAPSCQAALLDRYNVGPMDFECPEARYLVVALSPFGLGANVRNGIASALSAALATDRVLILLNQAPKEVKIRRFKRSWKLASCPRRDYQCFFQPISPCVLTADDVNTGYDLTSADTRKLLKRGEQPPGHEEDRVWLMASDFWPLVELPPQTRGVVQRYAEEFVDKVADNDPRLPAMKLALDRIGKQEDKRPGYNYASAELVIAHAISIYALRPNPTYRLRLDEIRQEIVPVDLDTSTTFGLPIRASDKCLQESECLSFAEHMRVVDQWETESSGSILFTSEASEMVQAQREYRSNRTFVTNTRDITPDTGFLSKSKIDTDEAMLSAMASLQLQLHGHVTVGNCCSNFHVLLADLLMEGCGVENTFLCLQENEDMALRICCGWQAECKAARAAFLKETRG